MFYEVLPTWFLPLIKGLLALSIISSILWKLYKDYGHLIQRHSIKFLLLFWFLLACIPAAMDAKAIDWGQLFTVLGCYVGVPLAIALILGAPGLIEDGISKLFNRSGK